MSFSISPTQADIFTVLGDFLTDILGIPVQQGQVNRTAEPNPGDYCVMWPLRLPRLATNIDDSVDAVFTGSIAGTVMTIAAVDPDFTGQITVGSNIFGVDVALNTIVTSLGTGHGGVGTYNVSPTQTITSRTLAAGTTSLLQKAECVIQIDVHGPNSMNNAQIISTAFRDDYAVQFFAALDSTISPLYTDAPLQIPFINAEKAFENRWVIELHLQIDQTVVVPMQFFDAAVVGLIEVDERYPASG